MEFTQVEMNAVEVVLEKTEDVRNLDALELVLVGGGNGEVVW